MPDKKIVLHTAAALLALSGCAKQGPVGESSQVRSPANVDAARLANADREPQNWYGVHRGPGADHFSPLDQINDSNAGDLGFAWHYDTHTTRGLEATPVVVDGVMYTSG